MTADLIVFVDTFMYLVSLTFLFFPHGSPLCMGTATEECRSDR